MLGERTGRDDQLAHSLDLQVQHDVSGVIGCEMRYASTMEMWTEQDVMEKLIEGWLLSGDIGADASFRLINPEQTRADYVPDIHVVIVRALYAKGVLVPAAVPGKKMMYRRNPNIG